ncbi:MAG TPA: chemotaxis protein CheW [Gemmatimonadaceae bacterium]|nr:chemotaxis protein CheW [Gemmatimonadaceae bacterium]
MFRDGVERLLVFRLGAERFGVALAEVDEVIDTPAANPVPDAPAGAVGVATVRGELVRLYDPSPVLRVGGDDARAATLLFRRGGRRVGLVVNDVQDAMMVEAAEVHQVRGSDESDGVLQGVVRRGRELIAVLDAGALLGATIDGGVSQGERR